jgi:hypothetical protein
MPPSAARREERRRKGRKKSEGRKRLRRCGESRVTGEGLLKGRRKKSWLVAGIRQLLDDAVLKKS